VEDEYQTVAASEEGAAVAIVDGGGEPAVRDTIGCLHGRLEMDAVQSFAEVTEDGRVAAAFQHRHLAVLSNHGGGGGV
jgi:hypothetical protein